MRGIDQLNNLERLKQSIGHQEQFLQALFIRFSIQSHTRPKDSLFTASRLLALSKSLYTSHTDTPHAILYAKARSAFAIALTSYGEVAEAVTHLETALNVFSRFSLTEFHMENIIDYVTVLGQASHIYAAARHFDKSIALADLGISTQERLSNHRQDLRKWQLAQSLTSKANSLLALNRTEDAASVIVSAVRLHEILLHRSSLFNKHYYQNALHLLANIQERLENHIGRIDTLRCIMSIAPDGPNRIHLAFSLIDIIETFTDREAILAYASEALGLLLEVEEDVHDAYELASRLFYLSTAYRLTGSYSLAHLTSCQSIQLLETLVEQQTAENHIVKARLISCLQNQAAICGSTNKLETAWSYQMQATHHAFQLYANNPSASTNLCLKCIEILVQLSHSVSRLELALYLPYIVKEMQNLRDVLKISIKLNDSSQWLRYNGSRNPQSAIFFTIQLGQGHMANRQYAQAVIELDKGYDLLQCAAMDASSIETRLDQVNVFFLKSVALLKLDKTDEASHWQRKALSASLFLYSLDTNRFSKFTCNVISHGIRLAYLEMAGEVARFLEILLCRISSSWPSSSSQDNHLLRSLKHLSDTAISREDWRTSIQQLCLAHHLLTDHYDNFSSVTALQNLSGCYLQLDQHAIAFRYLQAATRILWHSFTVNLSTSFAVQSSLTQLQYVSHSLGWHEAAKLCLTLVSCVGQVKIRWNLTAEEEAQSSLANCGEVSYSEVLYRIGSRFYPVGRYHEQIGCIELALDLERRRFTNHPESGSVRIQARLEQLAVHYETSFKIQQAYQTRQECCFLGLTAFVTGHPVDIWLLRRSLAQLIRLSYVNDHFEAGQVLELLQQRLFSLYPHFMKVAEVYRKTYCAQNLRTYAFICIQANQLPAAIRHLQMAGRLYSTMCNSTEILNELDNLLLISICHLFQKQASTAWEALQATASSLMSVINEDFNRYIYLLIKYIRTARTVLHKLGYVEASFYCNKLALDLSKAVGNASPATRNIKESVRSETNYIRCCLRSEHAPWSCRRQIIISKTEELTARLTRLLGDKVHGNAFSIVKTEKEIALYYSILYESHNSSKFLTAFIKYHLRALSHMFALIREDFTFVNGAELLLLVDRLGFMVFKSDYPELCAFSMYLVENLLSLISTVVPPADQADFNELKDDVLLPYDYPAMSCFENRRFFTLE